MKKYIAAVGVAAVLPIVALAQTNYTITDINSFYIVLASIINDIIFPILLAIAVLVIAWGIFKFILNAGDEAARASGRSMILWGIVGIFLMLSIWGLVNILRNSFSLNNTIGTTPQLLNPTINGGTGNTSGNTSGTVF